MKCNRQSVLGGFRPTLFALLVMGAASWACAPAEGEPSEGARAADTAAQAPTQVKRPPAGRAWVIFGSDTVVVELARTADERAQGLMYREDVPEGTGMLFIFEDSQIRSFWMANTYVPLDIAYMDSSYTILDILQMEPLVTDGYQGSAPAMFALEVPQGWFAAHDIAVAARPEVIFGAQLRR